MKNYFSKPYRWAAIFSIVLIGFFAFVLLNTFVIPKSISAVDTTSAEDGTTSTEESSNNQSDAVITDSSYDDGNIKITIDTIEKYDTTIYVADIQVSDVSYLKTALASNTYGRNIKETTSNIAEDNDAIFAINGDYYGFRDDGYVLRNGIAYRDVGTNDEDLLIDANGDFSIINENQTSLASLTSSDAWQVFSFGPALIENGEIVVDSSSEVSQSMSSNPRTAIGQISSLHYIVIVSDGRTSESAGLSLVELAQIFEDEGCTTAYNLDGGGSSTMYFNGKVVNNPTDGRSAGEREVSDIVYFGY
jgi:exopolysaccharide biosynthesis protein